MIRRDLLEVVDRPLTQQERRLLAHALALDSAAIDFREQASHLHVCAQSRSSWPLLEFTAEPGTAPVSYNSLVVAQLQYWAGEHAFALSVYQESGFLKGMLCWCLTGNAEPESWPEHQALVTFTDGDA
jgi:hypothetical protein